MNIEDLQHEGLNISFMLAGLFGSLLMMSKTASQTVGRTIFATIGGAASANYLTPLILHVTKIGHDEPTYGYSIAFLLGFAGLKGIEALADKIIPNESTHHSKRRR